MERVLQQETSDIERHNTGAFKYAAIGLAYLDFNGRFLLSNPTLQDLLGYSEESFKTLLLNEILHPNEVNDINNSIKGLESADINKALHQVRCFDKNGSHCWVRLNLSCMPDSNGKAEYIIAVIEDISEQVQGIDNPSMNRQLFEAIAESIPTTVWLSDVDGKKMYFVNQAFLDTWHISKAEAYQNDASELLKFVHPDDLDSVRHVISELKKDDRWKHHFRIITPEKKTRYLDTNGIVLRDSNGKATYLLGTHQDVTESVMHAKKLENLNQQLQDSYEEVTRLNQFDPLTLCFNRTAALVYISDAYYQFTRYEIPSSVIFIDLNKFKEVNDKYGHHAGDLVLKEFVKHMQERIRQTDTIGRLGGDEFILLFPGTNATNSELFLQKQAQEFTTQINDELKITLSYSAGVAECDFSFNTLEEWIDAADKKMYQQKSTYNS